ncbi:MAG: hypothetical protein DRQ62_07680, partial [Gammaproteobacteria bacterium]
MTNSYFREARGVILLAAPIALTTLLQEAMGFIDIIMLGRYDATQFAASGLGTSIWLFGLLAITGSLMGTSALIANRVGADNPDGVRNLYRQSLWLALMLGFIALLALPWLARLLPFAGVQNELVPHVIDYIQITAFSMPALALYMSMRFFSEGIEWPIPMMLIALLMLPLNTIGNYFLIFGNGGFPELGLKGAAISTTIGVNLSALLLWLVLRYAKPYHVYRAATTYSAPDFKIIGRILMLSIPIATSMMLEHGFFLATYVLAGKISVLTAAAHNIAINYAAMMFVIPLGIASATTVKVGNALGRGSFGYAKFRGWTGISVAAFFMLCSACVLLLFNEQIARIYTTDPGIIKPAAGLLMIAALFQLSDGIQVSTAGALRGFEDTAIPMLIN